MEVKCKILQHSQYVCFRCPEVCPSVVVSYKSADVDICECRAIYRQHSFLHIKNDTNFGGNRRGLHGALKKIDSTTLTLGLYLEMRMEEVGSEDLYRCSKM